MPEASHAVEPRRARVEIDLAALERNFRRLEARTAPSRVLPVVKADAYGHGAVAVARRLAPLGAAGVAVALVEEGIELRRAGVREAILVLSPTPRGAEEALVEFELTPAISGVDQLERIEAAGRRAGRRIPAHLKFDTGMTRLGLPPEAAAGLVERLGRSPGVALAGLMSHLAEAEDPASPANARQLAGFRELVQVLPRPSGTALHLANSAGALLLPETRFDLVRCGLALYGIAPEGVEAGLEPVMSLRAELVQVRDVAAGTRAGYGGRWTAPRPTRVGVVPVGYADGYPWRAGGEAEAVLAGRRIRHAGAISMDLMLFDLGPEGGEVGDVVTLLGRDGREEITAREIAGRAGTLVYEALCHFGLRLPRRVVEERGSAAGAAAVAGAAPR